MVRAALGKTKRGPFQNLIKEKGGLITKSTTQLSEEERAILIVKAKKVSQIELLKRISFLIFILGLLILSLWGLPIIFEFFIKYN